MSVGQMAKYVPTPVWLFVLASILSWISMFVGFAVAYDSNCVAAINAVFVSFFVAVFIFVPTTIVLLYLRRALRDDRSRAWRLGVTWGIGLVMIGVALSPLLTLERRDTTDRRAIASMQVIEARAIVAPIQSHRIGGGFVDRSEFYRFRLDDGESRFLIEDLAWQDTEPSWFRDAAEDLQRWGGDPELLRRPAEASDIRYAKLPEKHGLRVYLIWCRSETEPNVLLIWQDGY